MAYEKNVSVLQNNNLSLSGSVVTVTGSLYGSFMSGTVSEFTTVTASNLVAGGVKYPTTDGTDGQILVTDGAGELSFQDIDVTIRVKNLEATQIDKGTPLYVTASGTGGNIAGVYRADAGNTNRMPAACVAGEDISAGAEGVAYLSGFISGVNTSTFASGDEIYVAVGGGYTNVRPTGSAKVQPLGYVEKSDANGSGVIQGPGHFWELPNITAGHFWVGASNGVPTTVASSSFAKLADDNVFTGTNTFQDITADTITAREYHTELVSASIIYQSGSTKFGDTPTGVSEDTHQFSGSLYITGSTVTLSGGSFSGNGAGLTNLNASNISTGTLSSARLPAIITGLTSVTSTGFTGSLDGNANTATTLQTSRTINGVSFNGSSNITVEPYIEDDESTNATRNLIFTDNTTAGFKRLNEDSSFVYNPYYLTLGIGTSTPNYGSIGKPRIHLFGSSVNTADFFNAKILIEDNTDTYIQLLSSTTGKSGLIFGDSNSSAISRIEYDHTEDSFTHNIVSNLGEHYFQINSGNELVVKDNLVSVENNLAVGKSAANETLDVNGNGLISGSLTVTGTVTELSTRKIKKNIRSMKSQLETVSKLNPVTYYRRDTEEKTKEFGFISEEVKQVYPEFVNGEGVNYSKMVSVLVSAVKDLKEKVEQQQKEIEDLKKEKNNSSKDTITLGS